MDYLKQKILECLGLDPDVYKECDHCNGYGTSLKENSCKCSKCGGEGVILK